MAESTWEIRTSKPGWVRNNIIFLTCACRASTAWDRSSSWRGRPTRRTPRRRRWRSSCLRGFRPSPFGKRSGNNRVVNMAGTIQRHRTKYHTRISFIRGSERLPWSLGHVRNTVNTCIAHGSPLSSKNVSYKSYVSKHGIKSSKCPSEQ